MGSKLGEGGAEVKRGAGVWRTRGRGPRNMVVIKLVVKSVATNLVRDPKDCTAWKFGDISPTSTPERLEAPIRQTAALT